MMIGSAIKDFDLTGLVNSSSDALKKRPSFKVANVKPLVFDLHVIVENRICCSVHVDDKSTPIN